jgi:predicted nucleic acid-binding protein
MNLVDTDVLVDCLRGTIPAQEWLKEVASQSFAVPAVAARELVMVAMTVPIWNGFNGSWQRLKWFGRRPLSSPQHTNCC